MRLALRTRLPAMRSSPWGVLVLDAATVAVLLTVAAVVRLHDLDRLTIEWDTVSPFLRTFAWHDDWVRALHGDFGAGMADLLVPPGDLGMVQFGPGLVWSYSPLVAGASSLEAAIVRRLLLQSLVVAGIFVAVRRGLYIRGAEPGRADLASYAAGVIAALAFGFCGEPFGTAGHGDQTYLAPEFAAVVAVASLLAMLFPRRPWLPAAMAALPWAVMCHPMAAALAPGVLAVAAWSWFTGHRRWVAVGFALAGLMSIPEVAHLIRHFTADSGSLAASIEGVGHSRYDPGEVLAIALGTWWTLEPRGAGHTLLIAPAALAILGAVLRPRPWREPTSIGAALWLFALMTLATLASLAALGVVIGHIRPCHLRVVLPGAAVAAGLVVFALLRAALHRPAVDRFPAAFSVGVILASTAVITWIAGAPRMTRFPHTGRELHHHLWVSDVLEEDAGDAPRWFQAILLDSDGVAYLDPTPVIVVHEPAVYLQQRMGGTAREALQLDGTLYIALFGRARVVQDLVVRMGWRECSPGGERAVGGCAQDARCAGRRAVDRGYETLIVGLDSPAVANAWLRWLYSSASGFDPVWMEWCGRSLPLTLSSATFDIDWLLHGPQVQDPLEGGSACGDP